LRERSFKNIDRKNRKCNRDRENKKNNIKPGCTLFHLCQRNILKSLPAALLTHSWQAGLKLEQKARFVRAFTRALSPQN
jgi:hypothetical protein